MSNARACVIGDNTIDQYEGAATGSFVGGNAVNVAVHLSRLGHVTEYFGAVGDDVAGRRVIDSLGAMGVHTAWVRTLPGQTSVTQIRVAPSGERTMVFEDFATSGAYHPTNEDVTQVLTCGIVHIGMLRDAGEVRRRLFGRGVLLSQDCAVTSGYDHLDVAFCSAGPDLTGARSLLREAVGDGAHLAVATCGAAGSIGFDGQCWSQVEALNANVVDTTGAGDSYIAAFLSARKAGADVRQAMQAGAALAAKTCGHVGAWPQVGDPPSDQP
jgi:fructoselysine 6-kinase